jgi:hypothetical protein
MSFAALPVGISQQDLTDFGVKFGDIVALKNQAAQYPQTYSAWQDLLTRAENIRQSIANLASLGTINSNATSIFTGLLTAFIPASVLPESTLNNNIYGINAWMADANGLQSQLRQIQALSQNGLTSTEIAKTIQPTGLLNTVTSGINSAVSGAQNILILGAIAGAVYLYFISRRR